jgi:L-2-hydroxyglutarate oxidase LhgO
VTTPDVVVIGAGAIGASVALHLAKQGVRVTVVEKEAGPAFHQSGRNSGVIHSGYNLKPGSLKAKFCVEGSKRLRAYCREHGIPMFEGGILIVARTDAERSVLGELKRRADANGVGARLVAESEIPAIEPAARGIEALQAPEGASLDSTAYVKQLLAEAAGLGAQVQYDTTVDRIDDPSLNGRTVPTVPTVSTVSTVSTVRPSDRPTVRTSRGAIECRVVVNCAGLHADRLAGPLAADVRVIPFRGYYAELIPERRGLVRSHIYAAPDLNYPFLGVHLSRRADGRVIVGPGAMLAFGREAYSFFGVNLRDLWGSLTWSGFYGLFREPRFPRLVRDEVRKSLFLRYVWKEAQLLVPELRPGDLVRSYAGNRAQLVSRDGKLVDDIVVRETEHAVHVLNAVSPGLTCSLPFGEELADRAKRKLG